eukprot:4550963-Amphidinium_carterae.1
MKENVHPEPLVLTCIVSPLRPSIKCKGELSLLEVNKSVHRLIRLGIGASARFGLLGSVVVYHWGLWFVLEDLKRGAVPSCGGR